MFESGVALERRGERETLALGEVALRYGIFESVELRLDAGSWTRVDDEGEREGFSDPSLSAKVEIRDYSSGWIPESALVAGARLPLGDEEVGGDNEGASALAALAWELAPDWALNVNAGLEYRDAARGAFTRGIASTALAWSPAPETEFFAELYALSEDEESTSASLRVGLGASRVVREGLAFDLRIERGSSGADPDYLLGLGVSTRF